MTARAMAIATLLGVSLGCGAGFWFKARLVDANELKAMKVANHETAVGVVESATASIALSKDIASDGAHIDKIQSAVAARATKYLPKPEPRHDPAFQATQDPAEPTADHHAGLVLDVGTVRLLNAARQGVDLVGSSRSPGQE